MKMKINQINITAMKTHTSHNYSRRHFPISGAIVTAGFFALPRRLFAQQESPVITIRGAAATAKITVQKLRGNISVLEGSGGNIAVLTGNDGKLLIDAGIAASRPGITEALDGLSSDRVTHLINTHWHFDHTDGNEWLHSIGAEITAHENTCKHLSVTTRVEDWDFTFPPAKASALPTKLITTDETLHLNGSTLVLKRYGPSHTDSDISIQFEEANVIAVRRAITL